MKYGLKAISNGDTTMIVGGGGITTPNNRLIPSKTEVWNLNNGTGEEIGTLPTDAYIFDHHLFLVDIGFCS